MKKEIRICDDCNKGENTIAITECILCKKDLCDNCSYPLDFDNDMLDSMIIQSIKKEYGKGNKKRVCEDCYNLLDDKIFNSNTFKKSLIDKSVWDSIKARMNDTIKSVIMLEKLK